jgi:hypothetical protein
MSKNPMQAKQKLHDAYDPAVVALTAKPEMVFESGRVKIKAPIATEANLGPYTINVHGTPMHMSGSIKPPTISGSLEMGKRKYKYSADIEFNVDLIWHKKPKGGPEPVAEPVKAKVPTPQPTQDVGIMPTGNTTRWDQMVDESGGIIATVTLIIVGTALWFYTRSAALINQTTSMTPFTHTIDRRNIEA